MIFVIDLQDAKTYLKKRFSAYYFLSYPEHLHHFSKIKSPKEVTLPDNVRRPSDLLQSELLEEDRENGKATIEAMRRIRQELPECHILLGVSNISFGLNPAARQVLNSVFLHEAMQVGMDGAIVSANKILPLAKIEPEYQQVCRDLI